MDDINEKDKMFGNQPELEPDVTGDEPTGKYINPRTDFGFKHLFGDKKTMLKFLNDVLKREDSIVDLTYSNTERIAHSDEERAARFDLCCTTETGERVIIEMQNHKQTYFKDRILYYITFPIQEQAPKGEWNYKLSPVYSINIINFCMEEKELQQLDKSQKKYVSYVQLMDIDTKEVFSKTATFVVLELPHFTKTESELKSGVDNWMYILKNMPDMNDLPAALRNEVFEEMFQMAEIAKLSKEDRKNYYNSLKNFRDMNNILEYVVEQRDQVIANFKQEKANWMQKEASLTQENAELRRLLGLTVNKTKHDEFKL